MPTPDGSLDDIFLPGGRLRLELLSEPALEALREAVRLARETRWDSVRSPHVFMGLLAVPDASVRNWGERLQADLSKLLGQFQELFHQEEGEDEAVLVLNREFLSDNVIHLLREAQGVSAAGRPARGTSLPTGTGRGKPSARFSRPFRLFPIALAARAVYSP